MMPPTPPMPPVPIPVPPAPPPLTTFWKNLPHFMQVLGTSLIPFGAWVQASVLTDPKFVETFGNLANLPGIISMISGVLINVAAIFLNKSNDKTNDQIVDHAEAKVEATTVAAAGMIKEAAAAPAVIPTGQDPVRFRLRLALTEATDLDRFDDARDILELIQKKGGAA